MSNFQPGDETFDDVTGHKLPNRGALPEDEATEGHARARVTGDEADETEGHKVARALLEDDEVAGHRHNMALADDDDLEGHKRDHRA